MTNVIHLKNRAILGITGPDAAAFLQGTVTQDIEKLGETPLLYATHLSPQGRFLYDFFISKQGDFMLLDCAKSELMEIAKSLHRYAVGQKVEMHDLSEEYQVYVSFSPFEGAVVDPRHAGMGYRLITQQLVEAIKDTFIYEKTRIELGIPDGSVDGLKGKTLPAELGLEHLNAISFTKGCYVGQELTARMHHRTKPKKKLFKIKLAEAQTPHSLLMVGEQEAGWIFSSVDGTALALIKERYVDHFSTLS